MGLVEKTQVYEKVPTKEFINENEKTDIPIYGYGVRHVQTIILFICMFIGYLARAHLGVTIVAMTNTIAQKRNIVNGTVNDTIVLNGTDDFNITYVGEDGIDFNVINGTAVDMERNITHLEDSIWNVYRTYDWEKPIQDAILGAFFIGYCIAMFPTGMIAQRYGGKLPLQSCLLVNGLVSFATPSVAVWGGWKAVFSCRVLQGISQAGLYPSAHALLANWVPVSERATLSSFVYTGTLLGTVIAFQIGGLMATTAAGWPGTFWLTGALCFGSFLFLTIFGAASPAVHKTISEKEKNYILGEIDDGTKKKAAKVPWKCIFKSKPLWSTFATHVASGACFIFLFTQIPSYMHYILGFDVKNSGLLSSLPYVASAVANMGFGLFSDFVINRGFLSRRNSRIVCNSLAQVGPAVCIVLVCFTNNSGLAVFLLIMALALFSGMHSGWMVNYIDLSPKFSGSLMATGNTFSTICAMFLPILMSNVVSNVVCIFLYLTKVSNNLTSLPDGKQIITAGIIGTASAMYDRHQWKIVMFIMAASINICNALFVVFMSADKQPWDQIDEQEDNEKRNSMELTNNKDN